MQPAAAPGSVGLRLAPTSSTHGRVSRVAARGCGALALALGIWQVALVENGALGTVAGLGLIGLALPLVRQRLRAHRWAIVLGVVLLVTTHHGDSSTSVAIAGAALAALLAATPAFRVPGDPATRGVVLAATALASIAAAADLAHERGLLGHPLVATALCAATVLVFHSLRPWREAAASSAERELAGRLVERYGVDTLAPFALRDDKRYLFGPSGEAFLAYRVVAGVAIVSGDPVGRGDLLPGLIDGFVAHARSCGWIPAAVGVSAGRLHEWRRLGFHAHYTGDEAVVDPSAFSLDGRAMRKVRQSVTRLEREGYRVELRSSAGIEPGLADELATIAERWREGRAETGFSMAFESAAVRHTRDDLYAIARDAEGRPRGFLHFGVVPAGRALSLSSMRRDRSTPNGLNEFLICESLRFARAEGFERVSLNFAAFAQVLDPPETLDHVTAIERRALRRLAGRFQLERLLAFNRKFDPVWTPRYVAYPGVTSLPRIALAVLLAEAYVVVPLAVAPHVTLLGGLLLALVSAIALDVGFLLQQHAASRLPRLELRHPLRSARSLAGAHRWSAGFVLGLAGWALYVAALAFAPLSLVQAVSAAGVGLLVLLVAVARRRVPGRRQLLGALVGSAGLAALGLSLAGQAAPGSHGVPTDRMAVSVVLVAVVALALVRRGSTAAGGVAAGLFYGLGDLASKAALVALPHDITALALVRQPYLYVAIAAHGLGFLCLQRSFQRGGAIAAVAPMSAATNVLPMLAGVLVLGDPLPGAPVALALRLGAFAAVVAGGWLLAATDETAERATAITIGATLSANA